jgi:S-DNA-T family DNA segregation ATPase FtsK/SpoIIIE
MKPDYDTSIVEHVSKDEAEIEEELEKDEKYDMAVDIVIQTGQASISMIQRKLRVGYNRAARMIEIMEKEGIVGPSDGVKARDVRGRRD